MGVSGNIPRRGQEPALPDLEREEEDGESDEYEPEEDGYVSGEEGESDEDSEDEDEEEQEGRNGRGLTYLLLGDMSANADLYEDDEGYVPGGGIEPAEYSGDEAEGSSSKAPSTNTTPKQPPSKAEKDMKGNGISTKDKRSREDEDDYSREGKKSKAS